MTLRPRGKKGFLEGYFRHHGRRYRVQTGTADSRKAMGLLTKEFERVVKGETPAVAEHKVMFDPDLTNLIVLDYESFPDQRGDQMKDGRLSSETPRQCTIEDCYFARAGDRSHEECASIDLVEALSIDPDARCAGCNVPLGEHAAANHRWFERWGEQDETWEASLN